jgi:hypothetical protein
MLRWTTRLRDMLESKNYEIENRQEMSDNLLDLWFTFREAEFAPTDTDSSSPFPEDLNWETFVGFYRGSKEFREDHSDHPDCKSIVLIPAERIPSLSSAMGRMSTNRLIRLFSGKVIDDLSHDCVDVLWLSPTVFVSSFKISVQAEAFHLGCDYSMMISTHQDSDKEIYLFFYSLSTFETISLQYSILPLQFFQKIIASQPADFFALFALGRDSNSDAVDIFGPCPFDFYKSFLSIVSSCPRSTKKSTLLLPPSLTTDELQVILSHSFDSLLTLMFQFEDPCDGSVSWDGFNDLLRECHVPSLYLPYEMTSFRSDNDSFAANRSLQSLTLCVVDNDKLDEKMLEAISRNRSIRHLEIWVFRVLNADETTGEDDGDNDDCGMLTGLHDLLLGVFSSESYIKSLALHVFDCAEENPDKKLFARIFLNMMDPATLPTLRQLSSFNVSLRGGSEDMVTWLPQDADNVQGIRNWDQILSPWLVLNFYRENVLKPLRGGLVPLAAQAIIWGGVYRHTTQSAPSTMEIANAGLIYHVLRRAFFAT